jgi:hypothetical protein
MLTFEGVALIAEVLAAAWLIIALIGLSIRRTTPWLFCAGVALVMLMTTVAVLVDTSTS